MRIVAREECGCSRRIGSVQKDSAVWAVAAWGTHPFSTPLCPPRRYHLKDREKDVQEEWRRDRTKECDLKEGVKSKGFRAGQDTSLPEASPDAGTMDQVRPQTWRMAQTTRNARLVDLSSSNPIRWWPRADPEQKHDPGGTDDSQVER
jgi:hypothetical protein